MIAEVGEDLTGNAPVTTLFLLDLEGPQRPVTLQEVTGLTSSGVTRLLQRLEGAGVVCRTDEVKGDRRGVLVALTPKGRRIARRMAAAAGGWVDEHRIFVKEISSILHS
jgi:DNA-binding MarR family transcriptional regulator